MDKSFFPYGSKSRDFLIKRTIYLCYYLQKRGVTQIILACNTLSIIVLDEIKHLFKIPVIGVISLFDFTKYKDGLFIGSLNTINMLSDKKTFSNLYDGTILIDLIEKNDDYKKYIKEKEDIFQRYPTILLGCTHLIKIKGEFLNYVSQDELYLQSK